MDLRAEEDVLRITAEYVASWQAGKRPQLSHYLARYPAYAEAIAEFVSYFHLTEADGQMEVQRAARNGLSAASTVALKRAWERILLETEEAQEALVAESTAAYLTESGAGEQSDVLCSRFRDLIEKNSFLDAEQKADSQRLFDEEGLP